MLVEERTYDVRPGLVQQYLSNYQQYALAIQKSVLGDYLGFFSHDCGESSQVVHYWSYSTLDERQRLRTALSDNPGWRPYLEINSPLLLRQVNRILRPIPFARD